MKRSKGNINENKKREIKEKTKTMETKEGVGVEKRENGRRIRKKE